MQTAHTDVVYPLCDEKAGPLVVNWFSRCQFSTAVARLSLRLMGRREHVASCEHAPIAPPDGHPT